MLHAGSKVKALPLGRRPGAAAGNRRDSACGGAVPALPSRKGGAGLGAHRRHLHAPGALAPCPVSVQPYFPCQARHAPAEQASPGVSAASARLVCERLNPTSLCPSSPGSCAPATLLLFHWPSPIPCQARHHALLASCQCSTQGKYGLAVHVPMPAGRHGKGLMWTASSWRAMRARWLK